MLSSIPRLFIKSYIVLSQRYKKTMLIVLLTNWVTFIRQYAYLSVTTYRDQYLSVLSVQGGTVSNI